MLPEYDQLRQELINTRVAEADTQWYQAALIYALIARHKVTASSIAADLNCTSRRVNLMRQTFEAFPDETERVVELTFHHHTIATNAENPVAAIQYAADNTLSTRELADYIQGAKPIHSPAVRAWQRVCSLLEAGGPEAGWLWEQIIKLVGEHSAQEEAGAREDRSCCDARGNPGTSRTVSA